MAFFGKAFFKKSQDGCILHLIGSFFQARHSSRNCICTVAFVRTLNTEMDVFFLAALTKVEAREEEKDRYCEKCGFKGSLREKNVAIARRRG